MSKAEKYILTLWFVANSIIAALTVHEYGMSIDETNNYRYAADTLKAYPSLFGTFYEPNYDSSYDGHGPAFVTIAGIFIGIIQAVFPNVFVPDLWHFSYFITFQLTGLCLYWLTKRWFNIWIAWAILILFGTQPLLYGHAFINPKDTPFMFFLTLSVLLGFRMADTLDAKESFVSLKRLAQTVKDKFQEAEPQRRRTFFTYAAPGLVLALVFVVVSRQVNSLIEQVVLFFYAAEPQSWPGRIFNLAASPNVPAGHYVTKALRLFDRAEQGILVAGLLFFLACFLLLINNVTLSSFLKNIWRQRQTLTTSLGNAGKLVRGSLNAGSIKVWFAEFFRALRSPSVLLAGVALGLATGVRAIGPIAGVIVLLYLLAKVRSRVWTTGIAYFLVAGVTTYIAWPRLWDAPIRRYLEGVGLVSNFPHFPGRVLFNGQLYGPTDLPRSYLPVLLNIQFTEPLILCVYIGLGVLAWRLLRDRVRTDLLLYISLGFAFPLFAVIVLNSPLYHNFRQVLFLIPAMVMLTAPALDLLFSKVRQSWARVLLIAALAMPGISSSARLHPYEYIYYNSLVGGPAGALDRYELDYWRISLHEMALEMNKVARPGAIIVVTRSAGLFARYARPDLVVDKPINSILDLDQGYDYIIQVTRGKGELYREIKDLVIIERAGVVLATAKDVKDVSRK
jgi:4-amino-4-deoxy-L-arabinose transferase-like glycosyltransferase